MMPQKRPNSTGSKATTIPSALAQLAWRRESAAKAAINRRLRAEGLQPVELEPSLAQRVKKLQQLEARNTAESARRTTRS